MATFVCTIIFTEQGMKGIKESCQRAEVFKENTQSQGVKVRELLWTEGTFDGLLVMEAPDSETASSAILKLGTAGNVRTHLMRAYDDSEMQNILAKL